MIYQICDVMMSISIWVNVHFWIYLLNHNSLSHQTWSTDRYKQGQYFSEIFSTIWRTGPKFQAFSNLATCLNYSIANYVKCPVCHFFEKVNKGKLKMVNIKYLKNWQMLLHCHFIKMIKGPGISFQFPALSQKHVRNVCYKIP